MGTHVDLVLGLVWVGGSLPIIAAFLPFDRLLLLRQLVVEFCTRGKIKQLSSSFTVPQRFFLHFYLLALAWTTFLLFATWRYAYKVAPLGSESLGYSTAAAHLTGASTIGFYLHKSLFSTAEKRCRVWESVFLLLLMVSHVMRRLYETLYVFHYSPTARMHVCGYLTGLIFYVAAPLSLCHFCVLEAINFVADQAILVNVNCDEAASFFNWWGYFNPIIHLGWRSWAGVAIFAWGSMHQLQCHKILGSLRRHKHHNEEYVIPHGDWFDLVSSPHYFAEMIIYASFLVLSGGVDVIIWLLILFVVLNLTVAARQTQDWYLHKFEEYPRHRCIVLPFIF